MEKSKLEAEAGRRATTARSSALIGQNDGMECLSAKVMLSIEKVTSGGVSNIREMVSKTFLKNLCVQQYCLVFLNMDGI